MLEKWPQEPVYFGANDSKSRRPCGKDKFSVTQHLTECAGAPEQRQSRPCIKMAHSLQHHSSIALVIPHQRLGFSPQSCRPLIDGAGRQAVTSLIRSTATRRAGRVYVLLVWGRARPCAFELHRDRQSSSAHAPALYYAVAAVTREALPAVGRHFGPANVFQLPHHDSFGALAARIRRRNIRSHGTASAR